MDQETKDFFQGLVFGLDKRFDVMDKRFDGVERRLDVMESEVRGVKTSIGHIQREVSSVDDRLTTLEAKVDEEKDILLRVENTLFERIQAGEDDVEGVRQRVERVEDHVGLPHSLAA